MADITLTAEEAALCVEALGSWGTDSESPSLEQFEAAQALACKLARKLEAAPPQPRRYTAADVRVGDRVTVQLPVGGSKADGEVAAKKERAEVFVICEGGAFAVWCKYDDIISVQPRESAGEGGGR